MWEKGVDLWALPGRVKVYTHAALHINRISPSMRCELCGGPPCYEASGALGLALCNCGHFEVLRVAP